VRKSVAAIEQSSRGDNWAGGESAPAPEAVGDVDAGHEH
jgi:hypothetical protein